MNDRPTVLVAMGGHAFMQKGERGTIEAHERNARQIAAVLMSLIERDYRLVITHGNGPQVGNLLMQSEAARERVPEMPLDVLVAMTEGSLGYILQQALLNEFRAHDVSRYVVTVVTQVQVDEQDPAFRKPTKPIGPPMDRAEAERRRERSGWNVVEDPTRGWRRQVPSPRPLRVVQHRMIREAAEAGHVVIACGGGGIPIQVREDGPYAGVEAVVDKDLTSAVLAREIGADLLIILTAVPNVYRSFGKPDQKALGAVTLEQIEQLQREEHFGRGTMGPKIEAVVDFLSHGGRRALITDPASLPSAIEGRAGTHFVGKI